MLSEGDHGQARGLRLDLPYDQAYKRLAHQNYKQMNRLM